MYAIVANSQNRLELFLSQGDGIAKNSNSKEVL